MGNRRFAMLSALPMLIQLKLNQLAVEPALSYKVLFQS